MTKREFHIHHHIKEDGRSLWLYSEAQRDYEFTNDLPPVDTPSRPIKRMHPLRGEPVFYNPNRNARTLNPPPDYNPLAPVAVDGFPGEIPVTDFEVAIFDNRWPGLAQISDEVGGEEPAYGKCEVVVYSTNDSGSLGDFPATRIALLLQAIGHRVEDLLSDPNIRYVLPFENRGSFVGTTLPHPHGQIYAFKDVPPNVARQMENARNTGYFRSISENVSEENTVLETDHCIVFCPEFSRYPFELWIVPKDDIASPASMSSQALNDFSKLLKKAVSAYDTMFNSPMPYAMWHALPAKGAIDWPYHLQFWPLQRGEEKMKYLASVEQITGLFLSDVMPEKAARAFRPFFEV